jgi:hypothetical protein
MMGENVEPMMNEPDKLPRARFKGFNKPSPYSSLTLNASMADVQQFHSASVLTLVSFTTVEGTFFGMGFALYCTCVKLLYRDLRKGGRRRRSLILFAYSSLILLFTMINLANDTYASVLIFVDREGSVESGFEAFSSKFKPLQARLILGYITPVLMVMLTGVMQVKVFPDYYSQ